MSSGMGALWISIALGFVVGSFAAGSSSAQSGTIYSGAATYYSKGYKGPTASGAPYDADKFTAAHRTLPFGTRLRVTDLLTHRSVVVTVNDRGPFGGPSMIDLSFAAARALHMIERGVIKVTATSERRPRAGKSKLAAGR